MDDVCSVRISMSVKKQRLCLIARENSQFFSDIVDMLRAIGACDSENFADYNGFIGVGVRVDKQDCDCCICISDSDSYAITNSKMLIFLENLGAI